MKKQILNKSLCEDDKNQVLQEYGLRKPRVVSEHGPRFTVPDKMDYEDMEHSADHAMEHAVVQAMEYDDAEIVSDRHIKIVEKTDEMIAAATASNEPLPKYEIVWRKQDQPGNRRKPFTPVTDSAKDKDFNGFNRRPQQQNRGRQTPNDDDEPEDPATQLARYHDRRQSQYDIPRDAPSVIDPSKPMSRKEWLYRLNGKLTAPIEPIVTMFGPDHFTHHPGSFPSSHRGQRTMYQLENGVVVDGIKEDDDIPEMELTPLEITLNRERIRLERNNEAKNEEEF